MKSEKAKGIIAVLLVGVIAISVFAVVIAVSVFTGTASAQVGGEIFIDFENFPGPDGVLGTADDVPIISGDTIDNQFASLGVTFSFADGTSLVALSPIDYTAYGPPTHSPPTVLEVGDEDAQDVDHNFFNTSGICVNLIARH